MLHVTYQPRHPNLALRTIDEVVEIWEPTTHREVEALKAALRSLVMERHPGLSLNDPPVEIVLHSWRALNG
jgi:hypothetical protein